MCSHNAILTPTRLDSQALNETVRIDVESCLHQEDGGIIRHLQVSREAAGALAWRCPPPSGNSCLATRCVEFVSGHLVWPALRVRGLRLDGVTCLGRDPIKADWNYSST